jgi:hypothetical protein
MRFLELRARMLSAMWYIHCTSDLVLPPELRCIQTQAGVENSTQKRFLNNVKLQTQARRKRFIDPGSGVEQFVLILLCTRRRNDNDCPLRIAIVDGSFLSPQGGRSFFGTKIGMNACAEDAEGIRPDTRIVIIKRTALVLQSKMQTHSQVSQQRPLWTPIPVVRITWQHSSTTPADARYIRCKPCFPECGQQGVGGRRNPDGSTFILVGRKISVYSLPSGITVIHHRRPP